MDRNNHRVKTQRELYNRRQTICEHPFGTIKRAWGYSYTLLKGIKKVDGEMGIIFTCYNLRRTISIMGVEKLLKKLRKWEPDYKRAMKNMGKSFFRGEMAFLSLIRALQNFPFRDCCLKSSRDPITSNALRKLLSGRFFKKISEWRVFSQSAVSRNAE